MKNPTKSSIKAPKVGKKYQISFCGKNDPPHTHFKGEAICVSENIPFPLDPNMGSCYAFNIVDEDGDVETWSTYFPIESVVAEVKSPKSP